VHLIRTTYTAARARLRGEDGYTLVAVMGIVAAVLAISVAAFAATDGDIGPSADDRERKQAYAAAEAGVADYLARLVAKPDYWRDCANDAANLAINQVNPATRRWAQVPGATSQYSVELLPANDRPSCDVNDPVSTFIDATTGTFRIRSTGRARVGGRTRSIIATFRRKGFLDYIYYTDLETSDPMWFKRDTGGRVTKEDPPGAPPPTGQRDVVTWGTQECGYWRNGRGLKEFRGTGYTNSSNPGNKAGRLDSGGDPNDATDWDTWTHECGEIRFVGNSTTQDHVNGPLHTNDELLLCGTPHFGRRPADEIEISGGVAGSSPMGWRQDSGCSGTPIVNNPGASAPDRGTLKPNSPVVDLPPSNVSLKDDALPAYRFKGRTTIRLNGMSMRVTGKRDNGAPLNNTSMPVPKDGVIYVSNDTVGTCPGYDVTNPYADQPACGDVWLRGTYDRSITISAQNDIIIDEDVGAGGSGKPLLGLISDKWIRVYHPVDSSCENNGGPGPDLRIDAAILSLQHSFTVDNYWCGDKMGDLSVFGAIGQKYRGPVGTGGSSSGSGYIKDYNYNDDLRFRSPPRFLSPVQTTWKLKTQVEQVPAAR
jgi:hypothetical protein